MPKPHLLMLRVNQLKIHPLNIRQTYPDDEVEGMAESIRANDGVLHALLIVPSDKKGVWWVVDGNKRLRGAQRLGKDCPLLKCEPVGMNRAQQLLAMATTLIRSDPNPFDEARHYARLRKDGLSNRDISKQTGVYEARIYNRLRLLDLDEPIQKLMEQGKLPRTPDSVDALLRIPDAKLRIQLARRLAYNVNVTTRTVQSAAGRLLTGLQQKDKPRLKHPAAELSGADRRSGTVAVDALRAAARRTCAVCDMREVRLRDAKEPAWSSIVHAAGETCGSCTLRDVQDVCHTCPATELLRRLAPAGGRKG